MKKILTAIKSPNWLVNFVPIQLLISPNIIAPVKFHKINCITHRKLTLQATTFIKISHRLSAIFSH